MKTRNYALAGALVIATLSQGAAFDASKVTPVVISQGIKNELIGPKGKFVSSQAVADYLSRQSNLKVYCFAPYGCNKGSYSVVWCYWGERQEFEAYNDVKAAMSKSTKLSVGSICWSDAEGQQKDEDLKKMVEKNETASGGLPKSCEGRTAGDPCQSNGADVAVCKKLGKLTCVATVCKATHYLVKKDGNSMGWCRSGKDPSMPQPVSQPDPVKQEQQPAPAEQDPQTSVVAPPQNGQPEPVSAPAPAVEPDPDPQQANEPKKSTKSPALLPILDAKDMADQAKALEDHIVKKRAEEILAAEAAKAAEKEKAKNERKNEKDKKKAQKDLDEKAMQFIKDQLNKAEEEKSRAEKGKKANDEIQKLQEKIDGLRKQIAELENK
jgi:hypothetical protein